MVANRTISALILVVLAVAPAIALAQTAEVVGRVASTAGKAISGAQVELRSSVDTVTGRQPQSRFSDNGGTFRLPFDWADVLKANQQGATWEITVAKDGYESARVKVILVSKSVPPEVNVTLNVQSGYDELMSKLDGCADATLDARTVYLFSFRSDLQNTERLNFFHRLLAAKLKTGILAHLESCGLLSSPALEIKWCEEASVRKDSDARFAADRLGCPAVIWGYIEEQPNRFKSIVTFTAVVEKAVFTDLAPVVFSRDITELVEASEPVDPAYLAFSSFILGELYLKNGQTGLAIRCFMHAKELRPASPIVAKVDSILASLDQANPARNLAPLGSH